MVVIKGYTPYLYSIFPVKIKVTADWKLSVIYPVVKMIVKDEGT